MCLLVSILHGKWGVERVSRECVFMSIVVNCLNINQSNCCALLPGQISERLVKYILQYEKISAYSISWEQFKPKCTYEECIHVMCIGQPIFFWFNVILFGGHIFSTVWVMLSIKPQINWREIFAHHANTFTNHGSLSWIMFNTAICRARHSSAFLTFAFLLLMQMSHFGNMINSFASHHSLWHEIGHLNSTRGGWRKKHENWIITSRVGEETTDISTQLIRWRGQNELCSYKQTIRLRLAVVYKSILIFHSWQNKLYSSCKQQDSLHQGPTRKPPRWHHQVFSTNLTFSFLVRSSHIPLLDTWGAYPAFRCVRWL